MAYENRTYTSNTLWNDSTGLMSYAEQTKDEQVNWLSYHYVDAEGNTVYPFQSKTDVDKFQSRLNNLFLNHYNDFQAFLNSKLEPGVIDSWKDIEEFLQGLSDTETITLMNIIGDVQLSSGQLNIRMSEDYPGAVEAVTISQYMDVSKSYIDSETGAIKVVFNYE